MLQRNPDHVIFTFSNHEFDQLLSILVEEKTGLNLTFLSDLNVLNSSVSISCQEDTQDEVLTRLNQIGLDLDSDIFPINYAASLLGYKPEEILKVSGETHDYGRSFYIDVFVFYDAFQARN